MADLILTPSEGPNLQRRGRGRPKGSKNRGSLQLAKYVEATFAGATPGQQAAQLCMVTPKDLREARADAKALGVLDNGLSSVMLAMVVKAKKLAQAIGCETKEAWLLLSREREGLMAYIHQKQGQADAKAAAVLPVAYVIPEGAEGLADFSTPEADEDAIEILEDFSGEPGQVSQPRSHGER